MIEFNKINNNSSNISKDEKKMKNPGLNLSLKDFKSNKIISKNKSNDNSLNNKTKKENKIIELKINLKAKEVFFNENNRNEENISNNTDKFLISNILSNNNDNSMENKSYINRVEDISIKEKGKKITKNIINFEKIIRNTQNIINQKNNLKINNKEILNKKDIIKKKNINLGVCLNRKRFNSINYLYNKDKEIIDYSNNYNEIMNKSLILKLKYNSNNTSIESVKIENEKNKIKKLKKEKIFVKPLLKNCSITKIINKIIKLLYTVKNQNCFCTKENYISHFMNFKNKIPINIKSINNKKGNQIYTKFKIILKKPTLYKNISLTPITKNNYKNIYFSNNKKNISNPKKEIKDYMIKQVLKRYKIDFNKNIINNSQRNLNNNKNNKKIPLLKICSINGDIIKINLDKNKNIIHKDEKYIKKNIRAIIKYRNDIKNCPLCLKKKGNSQKKPNNFLNNIQNKFNNTFRDYIEKEEINKLKIINNKNNKVIKNISDYYSKTNRINKKIIYNYNKKNNLNKKKKFIDLNNNELSESNNYTNLISIVFPLINSYFNESINKINK